MSRKITANSFHHCTKKLLNRNHIKTWLVERIQICGIIIYTNTLEGFWSIDKNGIRGAFNVLCKKYLPFYQSEFAYKYNCRHKELKTTAFEEILENAVLDGKCLTDYKLKGGVHEITYGEEARQEPAEKSIPTRRINSKKKRTIRKTATKSKRNEKRKSSGKSKR